MISTSLEETLEKVGYICVETKGTSMQPLLVSGRDKVCIESIKSRPKNKDILLYKRTDGTYILHRVKKVNKNSFTMWGDNHAYLEYGITDSQILGIAVGYYKGEKYIDLNKSFKHSIYKFFWCNSLFIRRVVFKLKRIFKKKN
jgi:hypothetical protein